MPGASASTGSRLVGLDRTLAVERIAQGVDHAPQKRWPDLGADDLAGAQDAFADGDALARPEQDDAEAAGLEVEHDALDAAGEAQQLVGERAFEAGHDGDAVRDLGDLADLAETGRGRRARDERVDHGLGVRDGGGRRAGHGRTAFGSSATASCAVSTSPRLST